MSIQGNEKEQIFCKVQMSKLASVHKKGFEAFLHI